MSQPLPIERILRSVSPHAFFDFNWLEDLAEKDQVDAARILEVCARLAVENPAATFWEIVHLARHRFAMRHVYK
ncbi:MAG: hypothetical protein WAM58_08165 [Candidatus Acidiferrum sp.]